MALLTPVALPEIEYLVDGLIPRAWPGVLACHTTAGAAFLLEHLARSVATGTPFLGRAAHKGSVLLLMVDDPPARGPRRLRAVLADCEDNVRVCVERWRHGVEQVVAPTVAEAEPDLAIVDLGPCAARAWESGLEAAGDALVEDLVAVCMNERTSALLVHRAGCPWPRHAVLDALPFTLGLHPPGAGDPPECAGRLTVAGEIPAQGPLLLPRPVARPAPAGPWVRLTAAQTVHLSDHLAAALLMQFRAPVGSNTADMEERLQGALRDLERYAPVDAPDPRGCLLPAGDLARFVQLVEEALHRPWPWPAGRSGGEA